MAEVGVSVAAKLAEYLVHPTLQQLQYLFCVGKISRNSQIRKEELTLKQGRVQELVQEAINRTDRIDGEVDKWKNDVMSLIAEVENLEEQLRANNGCLRGWCPTWTRYRLCKKLANKTRRMIHLNTKSDHFNPFSHPVTVPDIEYHSSQNFKLFNSTRVAFDQLWQALHDDGSSIIGLWGMGGSGKTTLAMEVGKKAKESQLFDRVVLTTISQSPNISQIQDEIADTMGLKLEEKSKTGRAKRIALRFQSGERNLIILDDVWAMLNLEDIGIPFGGNQQRSCKVILTTRRLDVCTLMGCQQMIQLNLLKEDEAWALFQTHANVNDAAKECVAQAIVVECKGLPIAIVAMGTCLNGKGVDEMNVMLYKLRNAKPNIVDKGVRDAFACLELSYDYLATQEAKLLLLMCAMFPEDHKIVVEDLLRYGVGLGICGDVDSFETIRSQVIATIKYLIDSSLLMHFSLKFSERREYVTMHDVVRDFALWKASKEERTIIVNCTKEFCKLIDDEAVKDCYAASLWYGEENKFIPLHSQLDAPNLKFQLDAPKLKFLMLCSRTPLKISHASFEGVEGLQALVIMCKNGFTMKVQPQSIQWLFNLQSLQLRNLDLCDVSFVVRLTRLEIIDLQGSKFERIPNGIENLNKLKLLDLSGCKIDECCYEVIGRCSQLEELYISLHFPHSRNTNCYEFLVGPIALRKLRRYELEIGVQRGKHNLIFRNKGVRCLCLSRLNMSMLGSIIRDLARRATAIGFNELKGGNKSFMPNIVQAIGGMNELTNLLLRRCSEIECITDETAPHEYIIVPRLDELELRDMNNLKQLHRGPYPFSLLQKLERLTIINCPKLLHIFPPDCNLGNLKFLYVMNCPKLTSLFPASVACTLLSLEELTIESCSELKHVVEGEGDRDAWENSRFPKLKILSIDYCRELEFVCPIFLALRFVQLQHLSIISAPKMKFMFDEGQLTHDQDETQILLPLLEYLQLEDLPSLVEICSERYHRRWPSIKTIDWTTCPNMELHEVNGHQLMNEELYQPLVAIESILLDNCVAKSIFHYDIGVEGHIPTFEYLKELTLKKCAGLKFVFSTHICQSLPELTFVDISCCEELEAIFSENDETQKNKFIAESYLPKLKMLLISHCDKLKFISSLMTNGTTSMLQQLCTLTLTNCSQMEEVFKCSNHDIDNEREIKFPNMKYMTLNNLPRLVNVLQGFKLHIEGFCIVEVHDCPNLMPIKDASIRWTKENLAREYVLTYSQLNNNEALKLPLSVLNIGDIDTQSPIVKHTWQVIGDDDKKETNDSGRLMESEQQMVGGSIVPTQVLSFQYLHSLEMVRCVKLKFLFSASIIAHNSLPKLTSLTLSECEELVELIAENGEHQTIVLSSLRKIKLTNLPNFKNVCEGKLRIQMELMSHISISNCPKFMDSSMGLPLQQLRAISEYCTNDSGMSMRLEQQMVEGAIVPTQVLSFQYLHSLEVTQSKKLKLVFSMSTIVQNNLPKLTSLTLSDCEGLEVIFGQCSEDDANSDATIVLSSLRKIELINLPNFKSVCEGRLQIQMELMSDIIISNCPNFVDSNMRSTLQQLGTISLAQFSTEDSNVFETSSPNNANEERGMMLMISRAKHLYLKDSMNFIAAWEGPASIIFQNLRRLSVIGCRKLKYMFPSSVIRSLPCLSKLHIEECEELEEIIMLSSSSEEKEHHHHFPNDSSNPSLCFPRLHFLDVIRCGKLKWLFPSLPSTKHLPLLENLIIKECSQLKGLFNNNQVEIHEEEFNINNILPSLEHLKVEDCPIFSKTTLAALQSYLEYNYLKRRDRY